MLSLMPRLFYIATTIIKDMDADTVMVMVMVMIAIIIDFMVVIIVIIIVGRMMKGDLLKIRFKKACAICVKL